METENPAAGFDFNEELPSQATPGREEPVHYHPVIGRGSTAWRVLVPGMLLFVGAAIAGSALLHAGTGTLLAGFFLVVAAVLAWLIWPAYFRYPFPELNDPPAEDRRIPVDDHGTVHVGHSDVDEGNHERPYVWIWLEPPQGAPCNYQWYQFVRPTFRIDGTARNSNREFEAATKRKYRYNRWNPDYHVDDVLPDTPGFNPPGLGLDPDDPGKPFRQYHVPGARMPGSSTSFLTGILDAPNFCVRSNQPAEAERILWSRTPRARRSVERRTAPADRTVNVHITVEIRSYLVCIDQAGTVHCIGYLSWTYFNDVDVRLTWLKGDIEAGMVPRWDLFMEITRCEHRYALGEWSSC